MTRNAAQTGSARRATRLKAGLFALAALVSTAPAFAGDRAIIDFIGYSDDARYFAFEQFGIQDGSGFPYSDVFVIDLQEDKWVGGGPFSAVMEDDSADPLQTLRDTRAKALKAAEGQLTKLAIKRPYEVAALIGDGVPEPDIRTLRFGSPSYGGIGSVSGDYTIKLQQYEANPIEPCFGMMGEKPQAFALTVTSADGTREIHRDAALPKSRDCPQQYAIFGVVFPYEAHGDLSGAVALISVYRQGFEGPDRRFIAVPIGE